MGVRAGVRGHRGAGDVDRLALVGGWARAASGGASSGYVELTANSGAAGRLTFRGRSVGLYGPRGPSLGRSAIYLDGVRVATVNQWSSAAAARESLYARNGLSPSTTHVLEVRSLGTPGQPDGGSRPLQKLSGSYT